MNERPEPHHFPVDQPLSHLKGDKPDRSRLSQGIAKSLPKWKGDDSINAAEIARQLDRAAKIPL